jgi:hypothetical protein
MVLPDAIHHHPPGKRVIVVRQPVGESASAFALRSIRGQVEGGRPLDDGWRPGRDRLARLFEVAALEKQRRPRLLRVRRVDQRWPTKDSQLRGQPGCLSLGRGERCPLRLIERSANLVG